MYVSDICAEGIFVTFPWWLKNVKSRSKIALFSNERHYETWFPKKRTITFFWSKLSKLHKKDPILHVATMFSLKQGETRTSPWPIPHSLETHHKSPEEKRTLMKMANMPRAEKKARSLRAASTHHASRKRAACVLQAHICAHRVFAHAYFWNKTRMQYARCKHGPIIILAGC